MKAIYSFFIWVIAFMPAANLFANEHPGWTLTNFNNENGLPQNSVKFADLDNDGFLWLATESGIVRYDGQRFLVFDNTNSSLKSNRYIRLGKNNKGDIYCIDEFGQWAFYHTQTGFSKPVQLFNLVSGASHEIIDINRIRPGRLAPFINTALRHTNDYLWYVTEKQKGFIVIRSFITGYIADGKVEWADSLTDINRRIFNSVSTIGNQLCYINEKREMVLIDSNGKRTYEKIPLVIPWKQLLKDPQSISLFRQQDHLLLNAGGDIYEVLRSGSKPVFKPLVQAREIQRISCIRYYPEQGLLIIGSYTQGLFIFRKQQFTTASNTKGYLRPFYALAPYGNDQVLSCFGTSPQFSKIEAMSLEFSRYSLLLDHSGHYWFANNLNLLKTDEQFRPLLKLPATRWLGCIKEDERGTIWMNRGPNDFGRIVADTFQRYHLDSIAEKAIVSFIPAGNQTFWVVGQGLCMWLDVKHGRQKIFHQFDSIELRTAYTDKQGNTWLGSYGQGYFLFRNGRFTKMPEDESHHQKIVHCFLEDNKGFIWMTTNNGLYQCATTDLYKYADGKAERVYHQYYGIEAGLKSSEFNGGCNPSGLILNSGRFAFPSMDGVVFFHPDSILPVLAGSPLFIEQPLLDGITVNNTDLSRIPPSFKRLELTVSSPFFGDPHNLNIQYNIEGLDDHWYPLNKNNRIVLNRLEYGKYILWVRKQSGFGTENYATASLPLFVAPFFYQTWWFKLIMVAFIALLVLLFVKMRYRYLILQRNRLEAEVEERTSALVFNNKLMEKLTAMIAHDLKSPLYYLSKATTHLRNNVRQQNLTLIEDTSNDIKNSADQICQFIDEFSLWASSFREGFTINKTTFELGMLLQELELFFKEMLEQGSNRLFIDTPAGCMLETDRELLKVILRNIIDNANKHSQGCTISVSVRAENPQLISITISDTGEGMSEPVLNRIQHRIEQASTAASIERNSRLGYQMIIDFAKCLSATLNVLSERGKGTTVILHIQGWIIEPDAAKGSAKQVISAG